MSKGSTLWMWREKKPTYQWKWVFYNLMGRRKCLPAQSNSSQWSHKSLTIFCKKLWFGAKVKELFHSAIISSLVWSFDIKNTKFNTWNTPFASEFGPKTSFQNNKRKRKTITEETHKKKKKNESHNSMYRIYHLMSTCLPRLVFEIIVAHLCDCVFDERDGRNGDIIVYPVRRQSVALNQFML